MDHLRLEIVRSLMAAVSRSMSCWDGMLACLGLTGFSSKLGEAMLAAILNGSQTGEDCKFRFLGLGLTGDNWKFIILGLGPGTAEKSAVTTG